MGENQIPHTYILSRVLAHEPMCLIYTMQEKMSIPLYTTLLIKALGIDFRAKRENKAR